jgi:hypothetical protein
MKAVGPLFLVLSLSAQSAGAQTATAQPTAPAPHIDTVNVEGQTQKDPAPERHFSQSVLDPAEIYENGVDQHQYPFWKQAICVHVTGLDPATSVFVQQRIKEIATKIGAPVVRRDPCVPNVGIYFTVHPQELLDAIAHKQPELIYSHNMNKATMTKPLQAWYATMGRNWDGAVGLDAECGYRGIPLGWPCGVPHPVFNSRLETGLSPEMGAATILVDVQAVSGLSVNTLADYLALLALAETHPGISCQPAPSIFNLLMKECSDALKTPSLSEMDIALLTGLYKSGAGADQLQRQRVIAGMKTSLKAQGEN